jgi:ribonuclease R
MGYNRSMNDREPRTFVARVHERGGAPVAEAIFHEGAAHPAPGFPAGACVEVDLDRREPIRLLAAPGTARARLYEILERFGVDPVHGPAARSQLRDVLARPGLDDGVVDRTHHAYVTIDNADSRDLDQAMFLERAGEGYVVHYALADAAYYVRPGTPLFEDALARGTSYYLPHLCAPMLPPELSEGLVSLNPGVERRALVFEMRLASDASPAETRLVRARIRSRAKLSYPGVQDYHDRPAGHPLAGHDYTETLQLLREVGEKRIAAARDRDVVEFNRSELALDFTDEQGTAFVVRKRERVDCERWNEQISLLCNMEGANLLLGAAGDEDVQPIFRRHPAPRPDQLDSLQVMIEAIVRAHGAGDEWRWRRGEETLADYLDRLPRGSAHTRVRAGIERQVMFSNQASVFDGEAGIHFALGVKGYARFSSPMREVAGIFTHKEGLERVGLVDPSATPEDDEALRARVVEAANAAKQRQRKITKKANELAIDQLLQDDLELPEGERPERPGTVLGVKASRLYVVLDAFPVDLKVYTSELGSPETAFGVIDDALVAPRSGEGPSFRVGDGVAVRTLGYDSNRGRWQLGARLL